MIQRQIGTHNQSYNRKHSNVTRFIPVVVVDSLLIVTAIVRFCNCSLFYCALPCVHSSFAIILTWKRELVALLFFVFLVSRDCSVTLPQDATGLSAVCDFGIS